jgi:homoprotocatechuate degradation regulator HpaR
VEVASNNYSRIGKIEIVLLYENSTAEFSHRLDPKETSHGLTEQQWRILRALASVYTIEVTELARLAVLLGPSLSRILRDLEARHLIERRVVKADLRRGLVSISAKGLKLMETVAPSSEAIYAAITRRYGARRLRELQDMLHALEAGLSELQVGEGRNAEAGDFE